MMDTGGIKSKLIKKGLDKSSPLCYNTIRKSKEDKKMYEYTIRYLENGEEDYLYGYSERDLIKRYPEIPRDWYVIVSREYID